MIAEILSTTLGSFILALIALGAMGLLNIYTLTITAALFVLFLKNEKAARANLSNKQRFELDAITNAIAFEFFVIVLAYLAAVWAVDRYLNNTPLSAFLAGAGVLAGYLIFFRKEKRKDPKILREFSLPIRPLKRTLDEVKLDNYGFYPKYALDSSILKVDAKDRFIKTAIQNYDFGYEALTSPVLKALAAKFGVEIEKEESAEALHRKLVEAVKKTCRSGGVVRVTQLLQYARDEGERAFVYYLSQLCSGKFTPLGYRYYLYRKEEDGKEKNRNS